MHFTSGGDKELSAARRKRSESVDVQFRVAAIAIRPAEANGALNVPVATLGAVFHPKAGESI
jgi:hypothetical protein